MVELLPDKEIKKANEELIGLHKRVILNYLIQQDLSYKNQKRFFAIYDHYIKHTHIRQYFHLPIRVFVVALLRDELDKIGSFGKYTRKAKRACKNKEIKYV